MAQQIINDSPANSGLGDPLKVAFDKVNANDTELYTTLAPTLNRTAAEIAAGVTPTNYGYLPGNVRRYGADPTGAVDSTAAIQAAINSLPSAGGTVYFPRSSFAGYKVSSPLVIPSGNFYCRLTGDGFASVISMASGGFDLVTWSNPGAGLVAVPYTKIDNLNLNGGGLAGAGSLINTQYVSGLRLKDLILLNLPTTGNGILVKGNGATYSHEVYIEDVQVETSTGFAFVNMDATASDSVIDGLVGNGNSGCQYGVYINSAAGNNLYNNLHPYGCTINSLYVGAISASSSQLFTGSAFDTSNQDCVALQGSSNCTFDNCKFEYAKVNFADVLLNNATGNKFNNCTFDGGTTAKYAINETGTSNRNSFNQSTLLGTFSASPSVNLLGTESSFRVQGTDFMMSGAGSITAGSTIFIGTGASNASEATVQAPMAYTGVARKLVLICTNAPGAGQTFTATVRNNGTNTAIVATISGAASFGAVAGGFIQTALNDSLSISVVASAGAATSTVRATLVVNQ